MFKIKVNKRPIKSFQVFDILRDWDPEVTPLSPRAYINLEENEQIKLLQEHVEKLEFQLNNERDTAFKQGYEDGTQAVAEDVRVLMERLPRQFAAINESAKEQLDAELKKLKEPLLEFSLSVTEQLVGKALELTENQQGMLQKNLNEFIDKVRTQTRVLVRVNPEQIDWISKNDSVHTMNSSVKDFIRFIRDPLLKPGECILETEDFNIEGIVEKQLKSLKEQLLGT